MKLSFILLTLSLAGAVSGEQRTASFEMKKELEITVPEGAKRVHAWIAMPDRDDPSQTITDFKVESEHPHRIVEDQFGNEYVYLDIKDPTEESITAQEHFKVSRNEVISTLDSAQVRPWTEEEAKDVSAFLEPSNHIPVNDSTRTMAAEIIAEETNPLLAARALYDWILGDIDYWVKDPANLKASPEGDATYCLNTKTGNCSDFHSLWISLARSAGIPSRLVFGSLAKPALKGVDRDQSYHCWPEFYVGGLGWLSHDVAIADLFHGPIELNDANREGVMLTSPFGFVKEDPSRVNYYFGNLDERRVTWNRGRDLIMQEPRQSGPPINAIPKAYVEIDGKPYEQWTRKLTYVE